MNLFFNLVIFIFGLLIGSFLNCLIYRLEKKENFLKGRSYCPHCHHQLNWSDLIPILSFIFLKGKCRYCHKPISLQYPLVEISTALIFLLIFNFQFSIFNQFLISNFLNLAYLFLVSCFLIVIFVYDFKYYLIPDKVIYLAILIVFIYRLFGTSKPFLNPLFSGFGAAAFFFLLWFISRGRWMGFGDVKLGFLMGFFLSFPNILVALFFAFIIGAIIGIGLIIAGKKTLKSQVPFGPFLILGTFIALFWGDKIINWYLRLAV